MKRPLPRPSPPNAKGHSLLAGAFPSRSPRSPHAHLRQRQKSDCEKNEYYLPRISRSDPPYKYHDGQRRHPGKRPKRDPYRKPQSRFGPPRRMRP